MTGVAVVPFVLTFSMLLGWIGTSDARTFCSSDLRQILLSFFCNAVASELSDASSTPVAELAMSA